MLLYRSVVALYLHQEWWRVEDILRTSSKSRSGLIPVTDKGSCLTLNSLLHLLPLGKNLLLLFAIIHVVIVVFIQKKKTNQCVYSGETNKVKAYNSQD